MDSHEELYSALTCFIFIQIFVLGSEKKRIFSAIECISAVQGHPRSSGLGEWWQWKQLGCRQMFIRFSNLEEPLKK